MSSYEPQAYVHGKKLEAKAAEERSGELLKALASYKKWKAESLAVMGREKHDLEQLVRLLNDYKDSVEPIFDARSNSAQEVLQPSILEEFMEYMFAPVASMIGDAGVRAPEAGYLDLVFHPRSLDTLLKAPEHTVR